MNYAKLELLGINVVDALDDYRKAVLAEPDAKDKPLGREAIDLALAALQLSNLIEDWVVRVQAESNKTAN
jgi:hypothetical protein